MSSPATESDLLKVLWREATKAASESELPTKVGAALPTTEHIISGCNILASEMVSEDDLEWHLHAEANIISACAGELEEPLRGRVIAVTMFPCLECAKLIVSARLRKVVAPDPVFSRWYESQSKARALFNEFGLQVVDPQTLDTEVNEG